MTKGCTIEMIKFFKLKKNALPETGPVEEKPMETVIKVNGMMCTHCQARVESICKGFAGVTDAVVDLRLKQVTVTGNCDVAAIKAAINDADYEVVD